MLNYRYNRVIAKLNQKARIYMQQQGSIQVALIEDDTIVRHATSQWLHLAGYQVLEFEDGLSALQGIPINFSGVVISDIRLPDIDGMQLLPQLLQRNHDLPVILITGHGDVDMAVRALQDGAFDFFEKPFDPDRLIEAVAYAVEKRQLQDSANEREQYLQQIQGLEKTLIGRCPAMVALREQLVKIAAFDTNVIIYGDTGCGKELVAHSLHQVSKRSKKAFVPINCAAIPESLFESELFGHESGAFTGAIKQRIGKFEYADQGTLFFDEIESMPANMQVKVLRTLQENTIERIGGNKQIHIALRVIAAAKEELLNLPQFRQDLFYRLNVAQLYLPPLNERGDDVLLLFSHYTQQIKKDCRKISPSEQSILLNYPWPGNVRELKNVATRFSLDQTLSVGDILSRRPNQNNSQPQTKHSQLSLAIQLQSYERKVLHETLSVYNGSIIDVMDALDLPRRTLNQKMVRYGLSRADYTNP
jgi:two-component system C4-dicarboxylate transport response regulator DctD